MKFIRIVISCIAVLLTVCPVHAGTYQGRGTKAETSYVIYMPEKLDTKKRHPWILAFSPDGNGRAALSAMQQGCDDNGWILVASNNSKNGVGMNITEPFIVDTVNSAVRTLPVDPNKMYVGGLSGGAMCSHYFVTRYPKLIKGAVFNCGMISRDWGKTLGYPSGKNIVFITNPRDFRYHEIREDYDYVTSHGCNACWMEFPGGHEWAPPKYYSAAFKWLDQQANLHK